MQEVYTDTAPLASVAEFLNVIFGDTVPWVGGTNQSSSSVVKRLVRSARKQGFYFTTASYHEDEATGKLLRQARNYRSLHVVVLDDIGTKVSGNAVEPTYKLMTSEGNEQWGYVLAEPVNSSYAVKQFMDAVAERGSLSDAGVLNPSHLVRLPMGINGKERDGVADSFPVHLTSWHPGRVFTLAELADSWGLELDSVGANEQAATLAGVPSDVMPVAELSSLPVVLALGDAVIDVEDGKVHLTCPNDAAHSSHTGDKQSSLLVDSSGNHVFKCLHESCRDFNFDQWLLGSVVMPTLDEPASTATADITGIEAVASDRSAERWLLLNIVALRQRGFFNLAAKTYNPNRESLNMEFGGLELVNADGGRIMPASVLQRSEATLLAEARAWQPGGGVMVNYGGLDYVNTYQREQVGSVDLRSDAARAVLDAWLVVSRHILGEHHALVTSHMAFTIQRPAIKIRWQVLVFGAPRTGKTMTFKPLIDALGGNAGVASADAMEAGWGNMYKGRKALMVEEVFQYDRRMFNKLKSKLANNELEELNMKGESPVYQPNLYSMYLLTNHDDAIDMAVDEDKLLVVEAPALGVDASVYALLAADEAFTSRVVYAYLLGVDISAFPHGRLPVRTDALLGMIGRAKPGYYLRVAELHEEGHHCFAGGVVQLELLRGVLRDEGYENNRKGVIKALHNVGFVDCKGMKKIKGKVSNIRFWAEGLLVEGLSPGALHAYYHGEVVK
ncbi:MAG: hypothetical protein DRP45_10220 [Candidatus Zixiibacteriota bacterium]|nr:MAG: hypothetical protein DRP45_10220 [candidate division Zixibacteria bacterium]